MATVVADGAVSVVFMADSSRDPVS